MHLLKNELVEKEAERNNSEPKIKFKIKAKQSLHDLITGTNSLNTN